ncbi:MAG TPA: hypothetical protein VNH22_19510, partial [Blastocatellia bacterium]|nr:hypothetical protein [Blastocatellia bacterium]
PRADSPEVRVDNAGERLAFARMPTGVRIIGVNAGHAFSFVRDEAEELRWAAVEAEGSQFRSRDLFPGAAGAIALGQPDALAGEIDAGIPDVPESRVAYIDGYGNLKTSIKRGSIPAGSGTRVLARIGETEQEAFISDGTFAVEPEQLAFAPGSSGWTNKAGQETRWMELFLRGGNAWESFKRPSVGARIEIRSI